MRLPPASRVLAAPILTGLIVAVLAACAGDVTETTGPAVEAVRVEARGEKGAGSGGDIGVTGATPAELPRGIVQVDVTVSGSGFEPGSEVAFEIDGVASEGIVTNAVTYVDETTLVANVDVTLDAVETLYDVAVRNGPKKKGVGIDLLRVEGAIPTVEPVEMSLALPGMRHGELTLAYAAGDYVVGWVGVDGCGFVYVISDASSYCLDIPGSGDGIVYPTSVNASGRIVGTYYRLDEQSSRGGYNVQHAFVLDWPTGDFTEIVPPAPFNEAMIECCVSTRSVNAAGQVLVEFQQWDREPGSVEGGALLQGAFALLSADLQTLSLPTGFSGGYPGVVGLMDDGTAVLKSDAGFFVWNGIDEDAVAPLIGTEGQSGARAYGVTDDGRVYGAQQQDKTIVWATPFQEPVIVDESAATTVKHTADGRLVTVDQATRTSSFYCVSPSGVTVLTVPAEFSSGNVQTGIDGLVFGFGITETKSRGTVTRTRTPLVWDVSTAGGC